MKDNAIQPNRHREPTTIQAARWQQYGEINPQVTEEDDGKEFLTHMQQTP